MAADSGNGILDGYTIAVTRPQHQAGNLCRLIEAEGGIALRFPVIDIQPVHGPSLQSLLQHLHDYQLAIFVSANAVHHAYAALGDQGLPHALQRAAVGQATARALAEHGQPAHIQSPPPYNSEALLGMPELQSMKGKRVIIFRGVGGRSLLADTLGARGARVDYAEVYRRVAGSNEPKQLYQAWDAGKLDMIVVTSNEGLQNLIDRVDEQHRRKLLETALIVISERNAARARELGFKRPALVAHAASDAALFEAAKRYTQEQR